MHATAPCAMQVPFQLQGEHGLIAYIKKVLDQRGHAVICLAEGAGQVLPSASGGACMRVQVLPPSCKDDCQRHARSSSKPMHAGLG